jgi:heme oxygenase
MHQALHIHPFMTKAFFTALTAGSYSRFLNAFAGPWHALEAALPSHPLQGIVTPRLAALCADLRDLGHAPNPGSDADWSEDEVYGLAYTLVGSGMGSRVLVKRVRAQWPEAPVRYLSADVGPEWRQLLGVLEQSTSDDRAQRAAVAGAVRAFAMVSEAMDDAWAAHAEQTRMVVNSR